jgi:hypothetical protein
MEEKLVNKINNIIYKLEKGNVSRPLIIDLIESIKIYMHMMTDFLSEADEYNFELFYLLNKKDDYIKQMQLKLYFFGIHFSIIELMDIELLMKLKYEKKLRKFYIDVRKDLLRYKDN